MIKYKKKIFLCTHLTFFVKPKTSRIYLNKEKRNKSLGLQYKIQLNVKPVKQNSLIFQNFCFFLRHSEVSLRCCSLQWLLNCRCTISNLYMGQKQYIFSFISNVLFNTWTEHVRVAYFCLICRPNSSAPNRNLSYLRRLIFLSFIFLSYKGS